MQNGIIQKRSLSDEQLQPLTQFEADYNDHAAVQQTLEKDGYLFLRRVLKRDDVFAARKEVFERIQAVDEIEPDAIEGIATGRSRRLELNPDLNAFWSSVSEGPALRNVTHGTHLRTIFDHIYGEPAHAHDLMYLRPTTVGCSTNFHYDYPFFAGDSERILTAWIPLGDIPISEGPLTVVEGSNHFEDLVDPLRSIDFQDDRNNKKVQEAAYDNQTKLHPIDLIEERNTRLLSANFLAGDLVIFSGFLMHGSLDNHSPLGRVRLSCDVRYQPAADPATDSRYFGLNPLGSKGGGYGDMRGAKPLTQPW